MAFNKTEKTTLECADYVDDDEDALDDMLTEIFKETAVVNTVDTERIIEAIWDDALKHNSEEMTQDIQDLRRARHNLDYAQRHLDEIVAKIKTRSKTMNTIRKLRDGRVEQLLSREQ